MSDAEFRALVRQMRNARTRTQEGLETSKSLERQVDAELERDEQPSLFKDEGGDQRR